MEENILNNNIIEFNGYNLFVLSRYQHHLQLPPFTITNTDSIKFSRFLTQQIDI